MQWITDNRRKFARAPFRFPVQLDLGDGDETITLTEDVGRGGFALLLDHPAPLGAKAMLRIATGSALQPTAEMKARLAWRDEHEGKMRAGFEVIHDDPEVIWELGRFIAVGLEQAGHLPGATDGPMPGEEGDERHHLARKPGRWNTAALARLAASFGAFGLPAMVHLW